MPIKSTLARRPLPVHRGINAGRRGTGAGWVRGIAAVPAVAALGWIAVSAFLIPKKVRMPPALPGDQRDMDSIAGRLSYYVDGPAPTTAPAAEATAVAESDLPPLLLIHSVNAAASAYEVKPIYEAARTRRPVYALDLPGFGFSERSDRTYTPRLMTDAVLAMVEEIKRIHGDRPVDAIALSLGSEFLARAAAEAPNAFRSVAFVSPTGLDSRGPYYGPPGSTRGSTALRGAFSFPVWGRAVFDLLTVRPSIRFFLEKTWGSKTIDEGVWDYAYLTTHQPGAEHAPFWFVGGLLFSRDITRVYEQLGLPVLVVHGTRGDFVDYGQLDSLGRRPNWSVKVFDTGAFPQFERPGDFARVYDLFLTGLAPAKQTMPAG